MPPAAAHYIKIEPDPLLQRYESAAFGATSAGFNADLRGTVAVILVQSA